MESACCGGVCSDDPAMCSTASLDATSTTQAAYACPLSSGSEDGVTTAAESSDTCVVAVADLDVAFDGALHLEEDFFRVGWTSGCTAGETQGYTEGFDLGYVSFPFTKQ